MTTDINPLTPVVAVAGHDKPWHFFYSCTFDVNSFDQIGINYTQMLQEEMVFPILTRLAKWSPRYAQKCSKR